MAFATNGTIEHNSTIEFTILSGAVSEIGDQQSGNLGT
jgi:hypothetical protein